MTVILSLFSGAGGCSLGIRQAGHDVQLAVDIDPDACATYAANLGEPHIWQADLAEVSVPHLLSRAGVEPDEIDLIVGGPPCQGFSSAGSRDWDDPRNALVRKFVEVVTEIKPTWFIMENVEGLLTAAGGSYFVEAIGRFLDVGYWVRAEKIYMERYGLPQRRKRVIVVGNLEEAWFSFPEATHGQPGKPSLFESLKPELSVMEAIGDLVAAGGMYASPPETEYQRLLRRSDDRLPTLHEAKRLSDLNKEREGLIGPGETMRNLPLHLQHTSFSRRAYRRVMDGTPTEKRGGAPSGLKRLFPNQPSLTITSASPSEFIHPVEDRLLTLRECARIQSFPDSFNFSGSWSSVATQIGNAIPPLFMSLLVSRINELANWRRRALTRGRWLGIRASRSSGLSPALEKTLVQLQERAGAYAD